MNTTLILAHVSCLYNKKRRGMLPKVSVRKKRAGILRCWIQWTAFNGLKTWDKPINVSNLCCLSTNLGISVFESQLWNHHWLTKFRVCFNCFRCISSGGLNRVFSLQKSVKLFCVYNGENGFSEVMFSCIQKSKKFLR